MKEVYITHARRTAVGSFLGGLSEMSAPLIGSEVVKAILAESRLDPKLFDEIILGKVITGGSGQNPARQTLIHAGMPIELPATTINKVCGCGCGLVLWGKKVCGCGCGLVLWGKKVCGCGCG